MSRGVTELDLTGDGDHFGIYDPEKSILRTFIGQLDVIRKRIRPVDSVKVAISYNVRLSHSDDPVLHMSLYEFRFDVNRDCSVLMFDGNNDDESNVRNLWSPVAGIEQILFEVPWIAYIIYLNLEGTRTLNLANRVHRREECAPQQELINTRHYMEPGFTEGTFCATAVYHMAHIPLRQDQLIKAIQSGITKYNNQE